MIKKVLIVVVVVVAGLMLGAIFSTSLPLQNKNLTNKDILKSNSSNYVAEVKKAPTWKIKMIANPTSIKSAGNLNAAKELNKINKTTLSVTYDNKASENFTKTYMKFIVKSQIKYGLGALPDGNATPNSKVQKKSSPGVVFDIPDIKANSSDEAKVFLFGREKGEISVTSVIMSNDVVIAESNPIKVIVN